MDTEHNKVDKKPGLKFTALFPLLPPFLLSTGLISGQLFVFFVLELPHCLAKLQGGQRNVLFNRHAGIF